MTAVVDLLADATPGLRERKKQRTRATLIDAAVELCLEQGYEHTTVDQIAAIAEVSPRTFSRYFATKDAVYLTLLEDLVNAVAVELDAIPLEVPPSARRSRMPTSPSWAGCPAGRRARADPAKASC